MKNKNRNILKNTYGKLFIKTYFGFAAITIIFAFVLGMFYLRLYKDSLVNSYQTTLLERAMVVSSQCSTYIGNSEKTTEEEWNKYLKNVMLVGGFTPLIMANSRVSSPLPAILEFGALPPDGKEIVFNMLDQAFKGGQVANSYYSNTEGCTEVVCAVPIRGFNEEIAGAVVLIETISLLDEVISSTSLLIIISALVALLVAFAITIPFTGTITRPIGKMRSAALRLADGDYEAKTYINRKDEVG
ncbi:MAG: cell wall metabolism sensor histidine kinase WalK, partial [Lachnospiraceae bacterium]|nr:cell wall metabolism sensor histidine kinase WalK [Lachnospiraceae bacterium]